MISSTYTMCNGTVNLLHWLREERIQHVIIEFVLAHTRGIKHNIRSIDNFISYMKLSIDTADLIGQLFHLVLNEK